MAAALNFSNFTDDNESCVWIQSIIPDLIDQPLVQVVFGCFYFVIWLLGVLGNTVVIYVAVYKHVSFTVRTVFIVSLAVSDLIICFVALPITLITTYTRHWLLPEFLCYTSGSIQGWGIFISSFTLAAIAVDRYFLIVYPTRIRVTYRQAVLVLIFIWVIGYLMALPMVVYTHPVEYAGVCGVLCVETWPGATELGKSPPLRMAYSMTVMVLQFGMPICVCIFCYWSISKTLTENIQRRQETQIMLKDAQERLLRRRNRANRMMASMVIMFTVTWFPFNFCNIMRDFELFSTFNVSITHFTVIFTAAYWVAMTSVIVNPVAYSFYNETFRKAMFELLPSKCRKNNNNKSPQQDGTVRHSNKNGTMVDDCNTVNLECQINAVRQEAKALVPPEDILSNTGSELILSESTC